MGSYKQTPVSPHNCAIREANEETGLNLSPNDLHLTGIVSENGYQGETHWLMFLFEIKPCLTELPPDHEEGAFRWATRQDLDTLPCPARTANNGRSSGNIVAVFLPPIVIALRISPINGRYCNPP